MSRRPWAIRPSLVSRAISGVLRSGAAVKEVNFDKDGFSIVLVTGPLSPATTITPTIGVELDHREVEPA